MEWKLHALINNRKKKIGTRPNVKPATAISTAFHMQQKRISSDLCVIFVSGCHVNQAHCVSKSEYSGRLFIFGLFLKFFVARCCARAQRKSVLMYSVSHSLCTLFICIGPVQWIYKSRKSAQHLNARTLINHQRHTHTRRSNTEIKTIHHTVLHTTKMEWNVMEKRMKLKYECIRSWTHCNTNRTLWMVLW